MLGEFPLFRNGGNENSTCIKQTKKTQNKKQKMGSYRNYQMNTQITTVILRFRGQGGEVFAIEFPRHGEVSRTGILKAWGFFRSGFQRREIEKFSLENDNLSSFWIANQIQSNDYRNRI